MAREDKVAQLIYNDNTTMVGKLLKLDVNIDTILVAQSGRALVS